MQVETTRFGSLDIEDEKVISMPAGILGFAEKRFILLTPPNLGPFCWLQAVDNPNLAFVVTDVENLAYDCGYKLTEEECCALELGEDGKVIYLLIVNMAADPADITVNLRGPIVLNPDRLIARQLVMEGDSYPLRHPFFPPRGK
jgi:flagellar assembly factor FliW